MRRLTTPQPRMGSPSTRSSKVRYMRIVVVLMAVLLPIRADAQMEVEARGGLAVGSHSTTLAGLEILPRPAGELLLKYHMAVDYTAFAGYAGTSFGCETAFCSERTTISGNHLVAGIEYHHEWLWGRVGGLLGAVAIEGTTNTGMGAYAAGGLRLYTGPIVTLPGISYKYMKAGDAHAVSFGLNLGIEVPISLSSGTDPHAH